MAFHCSVTFAARDVLLWSLFPYLCSCVCCCGFRRRLTGFFAQIVTKADLETASKGLDNANKRPTKEQLKFVETNKDRY